LSRCIVVIPTYNECDNLPLIVPRVLAQDPHIEVLVVDDNSPDGTGKLADDLARKEARVHVLHRERKEGLGPAYRAGFRTSRIRPRRFRACSRRSRTAMSCRARAT
jgi:dolichol-phosphate mannosyltransferase